MDSLYWIIGVTSISVIALLLWRRSKIWEDVQTCGVCRYDRSGVTAECPECGTSSSDASRLRKHKLENLQISAGSLWLIASIGVCAGVYWGTLLYVVPRYVISCTFDYWWSGSLGKVIIFDGHVSSESKPDAYLLFATPYSIGSDGAFTAELTISRGYRREGEPPLQSMREIKLVQADPLGGGLWTYEVVASDFRRGETGSVQSVDLGAWIADFVDTTEEKEHAAALGSLVVKVATAAKLGQDIGAIKTPDGYTVAGRKFYYLLEEEVTFRTEIIAMLFGGVVGVVFFLSPAHLPAAIAFCRKRQVGSSGSATCDTSQGRRN